VSNRAPLRCRAAALAVLSTLFLLLTGGARAARPLVVVFPASREAATGVEVKSDGSDGLTADQRTMAGARAVLSCLNDSGAVMAMLYRPDGSTFLRATLESKLHLANPSDPVLTERLAIGKAVGAVYVVAVSSRRPSDARGAIEMTVEGADVENKKEFMDHLRMTAENATATGSGDSNSVHRFSGNARVDYVLLSAANTLVLKMLGGPLGDYAKAAPPPNLVPAAPAAPPVGDGLPALPAPRPTTPALPSAPISAPPNLPARLNQATASGPVVTATTNRAEPIKTTVASPGAAMPTKTTTGDSSAYAIAARGAATPDDAVKAVRQQADALLSGGNSSAAIMMLRSAIDQEPLSAILRLSLARVYAGLHRDNDAAAEAQRALTVVPALDAPTESELTKIMTASLLTGGDTGAARSAYEQIVAGQPGALWARIALAEMEIADGHSDAAEAQYRAVLANDPANRDGIVGLARLLATRGDYPGALKALNSLGKSGRSDAQRRGDAAAVVFDDGMTHIANLMAQNRAAWETGTLSAEAIYGATTAQTARITGLTGLLKSFPPASDAGEIATHAYKRRLYAASLLAQSSNALISFLSARDADSGAAATLELGEFHKELATAQGK
jgi:tetratricopeptide (TPR) repeat protein